MKLNENRTLTTSSIYTCGINSEEEEEEENVDMVICNGKGGQLWMPTLPKWKEY